MTAQLGSSQASQVTVQYQTTREDVSDAYWRAWRSGNWRYWQLIAAVILGGTFLAQISSGDIDFTGLMIGALVVGIIFAGLTIYPQVTFKPERRIVKLTPQGIETMAATKSARRSWSEIASVHDTGQYIAITVEQTGHTLLVPNRAFANPILRTEFLRLAMQWQRANRAANTR
jgi:hypothetical protein